MCTRGQPRSPWQTDRDRLIEDLPVFRGIVATHQRRGEAASH